MQTLPRWVNQILLLSHYPALPLGSLKKNTLPRSKLIEADAILALATDCNPGTSWNESMQIGDCARLPLLWVLLPRKPSPPRPSIPRTQFARSDTIGSIEVGKQADMLILSVPDYRHLGYRYGTNLVKQVIKRGQVYSVDVGYYRTA